ncbi:MAG: hypothetical protein HVN35_05110 [Methanobacteriaceae archaeon]|nr:hypothetical protein [Methanobacteriaceae archaeon]
MSEKIPPKLRKPGTSKQEKEGSLKLEKLNINLIKEKLGSLKINKPETGIKNKVTSLKSKTKEDANKNDGPLKLRTPDTEKKTESKVDLLKNAKQIVSERPLLSLVGLAILIIIIISIAVWSAADRPNNFTNNTTNNFTTFQNHYSDGNISFDYPEGWNVTRTGNSTNQYKFIVTVSKNENNSFTIFKQDLGLQNFTYLVAAWRSNILKNGMIYYEGDLTIDNTTAYELEANYKPGDTVFTTRGIAFKKNNTAYFLIFVFDDPLLEYKNEMDKVINSFHVIEKVEK